MCVCVCVCVTEGLCGMQSEFISTVGSYHSRGRIASAQCACVCVVRVRVRLEVILIKLETSCKGIKGALMSGYYSRSGLSICCLHSK